VSNATHLDAVILKALALKHVGVAKQYALHLLLRFASKCLGDRLVDALGLIDGEPLGPGVTVGLHGDLDHRLGGHGSRHTLDIAVEFGGDGLKWVLRSRGGLGEGCLDRESRGRIREGHCELVGGAGGHKGAELVDVAHIVVTFGHDSTKRSGRRP
jgi:hypothetical protein